MPALTYTLPTVGQPASTEDAKVVTALSQILSTVNGQLDVSNLAASLQQLLVPTGGLLPSAASATPTGYLPCDGTAVSRSTYAALFAAIGTNYGVGDGTTTFNVPDYRGRVIMGKGTHTEVDALGDNEGLAVASRRGQHTHGHDHTHVHTHTHNYGPVTTDGPSGGGFGAVTAGSAFASGTHTHTVSGSTGGAVATATTSGPSSVTTDLGNGIGYAVANVFIKT